MITILKNIILASTSTLFGGQYLEYLRAEIEQLFQGIDTLTFVPYARPGGISHDDYTDKAAAFFEQINIKVVGLHTYENVQDGVRQAQAFFTGGGNTFLLVKMLHELGLMSAIKNEINAGKPYLGCSAGSNIGGVNMKTTNDMPIVYPPSFECMALVPFNLNPHYLDPDPNSTHNGETRETRILEFHSQNDVPVVGLREGNWVRVHGDTCTLEGTHDTRIFEAGKAPYELPSGAILHF